MNQKVLEVGPVTRIEGLLKVSVDLDRNGDVAEAHVNILEFRGFEKFLSGRLFHKAPMITTRICGVCPVPHHLASAKACDSGLGVEITPTAAMLRELMLLGEFIGDHTFHIFVLAGPDILLSDLPETRRGISELYSRFPDVVKNVIRIRSVGQEIVSQLGVQATHPMTVIPGGINRSLTKSDDDKLLKRVQEAKEKIRGLYDTVFVPTIEKSIESYRDLGHLGTNYLGLVKNGGIELYDGACKIVDESGRGLAEFHADDYLNHLQERTMSYSYAKRVFLKSQGVTEGIVRVGPLSRVNVSNGASTDFANTLVKEFKTKFGSPSDLTLSYHAARYVCLIYAIERAEQLLQNPKITSTNVKVPWKVKAGEGVGIVEAPRGLLIHHYSWNSDGYITKANLIVPTTTNSYPMDQSMKSVAQRSISKGNVDEERLWHEVGLTLRAYDPCISCSTHLDDSLVVELRNADGDLVKTIGR